MRIAICQDETIHLDLDCIAQNVNRLASELAVTAGNSGVSIQGPFISWPHTYEYHESDWIRKSRCLYYGDLLASDVPP